MENVLTRSEYETVSVTNPLKEKFVCKFNGEPYTFEPGETKVYPFNVAYHIARHMSNAVLGEEVIKLKKKKTENPYRPEVGQLLVYDNPKRRMALYDILGSDEEVKGCIASFPWKGFIGEKKEYEDYVKKHEEKKTPKKETKEKLQDSQ